MIQPLSAFFYHEYIRHVTFFDYTLPLNSSVIFIPKQSTRNSPLFLPALWNIYPVKCEAYFSGAKPISQAKHTGEFEGGQQEDQGRIYSQE